MADVFLSYVHEDAVGAHAIERALQGFGAEVWTDRKVAPGEDWAEQIEKRLADSDVIMLLITPSYLGFHWAQLEMGYALGRSLDKGVEVVPILLRDAVLPRFLNRFSVIDARQLSANELADKMRAFGSAQKASA